MECRLRQNVIQRDWRNAIDKYYWYHGYRRRPEYVEMNLRTFDMLCVYVAKHYGEWTAVLERKLKHRYSGSGAMIDVHEEIYFEGIKIYLNRTLEDEVMWVW